MWREEEVCGQCQRNEEKEAGEAEFSSLPSEEGMRRGFSGARRLELEEDSE